MKIVNYIIIESYSSQKYPNISAYLETILNERIEIYDGIIMRNSHKKGMEWLALI